MRPITNLVLVLLTFVKIKCDSAINDCLHVTNHIVIVDYGPSYHISKNNESNSMCKCDNKPCIRKCCTNGYSILNKMCSKYDIDFRVPVYNGSELMSDNETNFNFIFGMQCAEFYAIKANDEEFFIQSDGRMWIPSLNEYHDNSNFCIEHFQNIGFSALVCFKEVESHKLSKNVNIIGNTRTILLINNRNMSLFMGFPVIITTV